MTISPGSDTYVRSEIVVAAPIERAFEVFTQKFDRIKPREHNMLGADIAESIFEPRAGGRVYDRGVDGTECQWAPVVPVAGVVSAKLFGFAWHHRDRHS